LCHGSNPDFESDGSLALGVISRGYYLWKAYRASISAQYFQEAISKTGVFHTKCKRAHDGRADWHHIAEPVRYPMI
jgi:hypothetical protein